jgi:hypothetical protein
LLQLLSGVLQATCVLHGGLLTALSFTHARGELGNAALDSVTYRFELLCVLAALFLRFLLSLGGLGASLSFLLVVITLKLDILSACIGVEI